MGCVKLQSALWLRQKSTSASFSDATNREGLAMTRLLTGLWLLAVTIAVTLMPVLAVANNLQTGGPV